MATGALGQPVFRAQRILRVLVMVENDGFPVFVRMAARALRAEPSPVSLAVIVFFVTGDAGGGCTLEFRIRMAVPAGDVAMHAGQREFRFAVVKEGFLPVAFLMAVGTLRAQGAFVLVILPVTGKTVRRCVAEFDFGFMAIVTRNFGPGVCTLQPEVGERVIERLFVDRRDIHRAPLVFGMTVAALLVLDTAVVTLFLGDVLGDVLVAVQAQTVLGGFFEARMAVFTVAFQFGVPRNQLAGHQHAFERVRVRSGRQTGKR